MNEEQNKKIATLAITLLGGSDSQISVEQVLPYVAESVQRIENYCNRDDLPTQLEYTAARAAATLYTNIAAQGEQLPSGNIIEYSEADATVKFDTSNSKAVAILNNFILNVSLELNRWRMITFD